MRALSPHRPAARRWSRRHRSSMMSRRSREVRDMLQRIDMVAVYVRDWSAAVAWYEESLGFSKVYVEDDHHFAVMGLPGGGPVLHLVGSSVGDEGTRNRCHQTSSSKTSTGRLTSYVVAVLR